MRTIVLAILFLASCMPDKKEKQPQTDLVDTTLLQGKDSLADQDSMPTSMPPASDTGVVRPENNGNMPIKKP